MIVMKFGGTSVGSADNIRKVAGIIKSNLKNKPVVVVSAVSGITNLLIKLANETLNGSGDETLEKIKSIHSGIIRELKLDELLINGEIGELQQLFIQNKKDRRSDAKTLDLFQSFGERMSSKIIAAFLKEKGVSAEAFDAWDIGLITNSEFGKAEPLEKSFGMIDSKLKALKLIPIITGFLGRAESGEITTLGRGGSDYSAAIIGSAINAEEIQIWTDVDGIMSTDPKIVKEARTINAISFEEASELSYFGAKVLHPKTILPAMRKNIPVKVLNTFNPSGNGTTIVNESKKIRNTIKAIACKNNTTLIHIDSSRMLGAYGFLARIFYIFDKYRKSVDVVSTSEVSVSLTVDNGENVENIINEIREIAQVEISKNKSIICVVGEGMRNDPNVHGTIFSLLAKNKINVDMISWGASKINMTFIVDGNNADETVRILHKSYFG